MSNLTIKDIAKLCGVGVSTVSRALNDHPDINQKTKEEILRVVKENHFVPNSNARNLKKTEPRMIAIMIKGWNNPFFLSMIEVFEEMLTKYNYSFELHRVPYEEDELAVAKERLQEKKLEGIIFLGGKSRVDYSAFDVLEIPYVICAPGIQPFGQHANCVSIDDVKESFRAVDYLCSLGHRRIAIITIDHEKFGAKNFRLDGYRQALEKNRIPFEQSLVCYMENDFIRYTVEAGFVSTKKLLDSNIDFTAIFATTDLVALGVCKALLEAGKRIPQDYSVIGFDGLDLMQYFHPSITTIRQPRVEMAKEAVNLLLDEIEGREHQRTRIFEAELMRLESTGEARTDT